MARNSAGESGRPPAIKRPGDRRSLSRSATRALDVLELFGIRRDPLRAVDIAIALDMNPSSTDQLLKTMVGSGHLVFDGRAKTYLPSARLTKFCGWVSDLYGAQVHFSDLLRTVQQRTGMVATLSSPNDLFMQITESAAPQDAVAERGLRISLFGSAVGGAYLSTLADGEVLRLAERARIPPAQQPAILEHVATIRASGFAEASNVDDNVSSIAMPLPNHVVGVPMVLGLAGPTLQVRDDAVRLVDILRTAIRLHLGGSPMPGEDGERPGDDLAGTRPFATADDRDMVH